LKYRLIAAEPKHVRFVQIVEFESTIPPEPIRALRQEPLTIQHGSNQMPTIGPGVSNTGPSCLKIYLVMRINNRSSRVRIGKLFTSSMIQTTMTNSTIVKGPLLGMGSVCDKILIDLPDWFGIGEANNNIFHRSLITSMKIVNEQRWLPVRSEPER